MTPMEAQAKAHRNRLRTAIDNMERTSVCLDLFDRAITDAYAQGRRAGLEEAATIVVDDGNPAVLKQRLLTCTQEAPHE